MFFWNSIRNFSRVSRNFFRHSMKDWPGISYSIPSSRISPRIFHGISFRILVRFLYWSFPEECQGRWGVFYNRPPPPPSSLQSLPIEIFPKIPLYILARIYPGVLSGISLEIPPDFSLKMFPENGFYQISFFESLRWILHVEERGLYDSLTSHLHS